MAITSNNAGLIINASNYDMLLNGSREIHLGTTDEVMHRSDTTANQGAAGSASSIATAVWEHDDSTGLVNGSDSSQIARWLQNNAGGQAGGTPGVGTYTCTYSVIDTSIDSAVTGVKITVTNTSGSFSNFTSRSNGTALIGGNDGDTLVITGCIMAGYQFNTPDTLIFPDSSWVDTMKCYNEFSSSKCLVYANLKDLGYDDAENVLVTTKLLSRAVKDTCSGTILVDYEKQQGYADASGYIEFYLTPSSCISNKKYIITFEYQGQVGKTKKFEVPSQSTYDLYNAMP